MNRWAFNSLIVLLLAAAGGCNCCSRKGLVLRGDWSLELNRMPHMKSNGAQYDACDGCDPGCIDAVSCGPADGCVDGSCGGCRLGRRCCLGRGVGGQYLDEYGAEPMAHPQPPLPTPAAQSRFHPVPTRPVFEPEFEPAYVPAMPAIPDMIQPTSASTTGWKTKRRA